MKVSWQREWPQWLMIGLMFLGAALLWNRAPDQIPALLLAEGEAPSKAGKDRGVSPGQAVDLTIDHTMGDPGVRGGRQGALHRGVAHDGQGQVIVCGELGHHAQASQHEHLKVAQNGGQSGADVVNTLVP